MVDGALGRGESLLTVVRCNFVQSETANRDRSTETAAQIQAERLFGSQSLLVYKILAIRSLIFVVSVAFSTIVAASRKIVPGPSWLGGICWIHVGHFSLIRFGFSPKVPTALPLEPRTTKNNPVPLERSIPII